MNKLVSDGSVKKINYPVLYESGKRGSLRMCTLIRLPSAGSTGKN